jgi:short-chain fatty acids transporter
VGLVASALLAQQLKQKFPNLSYAHIVATCFSGFLVWHGGLSGSIPLQLATMSGEMFYPVQKTLFSHYNLVILALHFFGLPIVNYVFYRTHRDATLVEKISFHEQSNKKEVSSALVAVVLSIVGLLYFVMALYRQGTLDLNLFIVFLLFAGILLHKGLKQYEVAFEQSISVGAGIVLLFPFYAAMMGLISQSGFGKLVTEFFTQFANTQNLPLISYLSAGFLNIFVPSGGGQWAIQAPIFIPLAQKLNVDVSRVAMMIAWGDAWTNMLQPFFALPLLSIAKIELKQIMPQCFWLFISS